MLGHKEAYWFLIILWYLSTPHAPGKYHFVKKNLKHGRFGLDAAGHYHVTGFYAYAVMPETGLIDSSKVVGNTWHGNRCVRGTLLKTAGEA